MKKATMCIIIFGTLILFFAVFFVRNIYVPKDAQKKAVRQSEILNNNYILCKRARVTGFDWYVVQNEHGVKEHEFCNIVGANPFSEFNFNYDFVMADNTYIFYVDDVEFVFSESIGTEAKLYHATGWDVMYPIKRESIFGFFNSKKYIRLNDCQSKT